MKRGGPGLGQKAAEGIPQRGDDGGPARLRGVDGVPVELGAGILADCVLGRSVLVGAAASVAAVRSLAAGPQRLVGVHHICRRRGRKTGGV